MGRKIGVIISLADISELKYVRKEMEKMNRLSTIAEIASAVAHEVRNPLAGIKIMAQSIEEEAKDNSEQQECAQRISRQVDRLNVLLSDFFSYARPAEPNKRPTSLEAIIVETQTTHQQPTDQKSYPAPCGYQQRIAQNHCRPTSAPTGFPQSLSEWNRCHKRTGPHRHQCQFTYQTPTSAI